MMTPETTKTVYRVDRREIAFIKFIVEAYEGMAVFSTRDAEMGIVEFSIAPGCEAEFEGLMAALKKDVMISGPMTENADGLPISRKK